MPSNPEEIIFGDVRKVPIPIPIDIDLSRVLPFIPEDKKAGDVLKSQDWNAGMQEIMRLNKDKVDRKGDVITGSLSIGDTLKVLGNGEFKGSLAVTENHYLSVKGEPAAGKLRVGAAWGIPGLYSGDSPEIVLSKDLILGAPKGNKVYLGFNQEDAYVESGTGNAYLKGKVGIGTTDPKAQLQVTGIVNITSGSGNNIANMNNRMAPGSLTIGGIDRNYGGGNQWSTNTAGLLLETLDNTEIAVHDAGIRLASFMYYEGAANKFTIGRDMGWGKINTVQISGALSVVGNSELRGNVGIGTNSPTSKLDIQSVDRSGTHPTSVKGLYVTGDFGPDSDGVEFRHTNGTQGIGFGYNTIYATGGNTNQDLGLKSKGTGKVNITGTLSVSKSIIPIGSSASSSETSGGIVFPANAFGGGGDAAWIHYYARSSESCTLEIGVANDVDDHIILNTAGNVGIGTSITPQFKLDVQGDVRCNFLLANNVSNFSSRDIKQDITSLSDDEARSMLNDLNPVKYDYKIEQKFRQNLGFIAEEMPDGLRSEDRKTISPLEIIPVLTKMIQLQQQAINSLQEDLRSLKASIELG